MAELEAVQFCQLIRHVYSVIYRFQRNNHDSSNDDK